MLVCSMTLTLSSCKDDIKITRAPMPGGGSSTGVPQEDDMKVRIFADLPTAVRSEFDETSMGAAFVRRLPLATVEVTSETKMILIKGEDIPNRMLSEWLKAAKLYLQGGYIAIEKPSDAHLVYLMEHLADNMEKAEEDLLQEDEGNGITVTITPSNGGGKAPSLPVQRLKNRIAHLQAHASRRADGDKKPVAEMVILGRDCYYHCEPYQGKIITTMKIQKDGTMSYSTIAMNPDYSRRNSGVMADGAAQWLNRREISFKERKKMAQQLAARREDGIDAINELTSASEEYTYQGGVSGLGTHVDRWLGVRQYFGFVTKLCAYQETCRVWGVYDKETNKDYYLVKQHAVTAIGGKMGDDLYDFGKSLYQGPYEADKWYYENTSGTETITFEDKTFDHFYGSWFDNSEYSMNLSGKGSILLEEALPESDDPTNNAEALKCVKNTQGTKVQWLYDCSKNMLDGDVAKHPLAPDALTNDVNINNQICWSVSDPDAAYTVSIIHRRATASLLQNGSDKIKNQVWEESFGSGTEDQFTMTIPNRTSQIWYMDVTFPEIGQEGYEEVKTKLITALQNQFPNLYQPTREMADQTPESENTIKQVVYDTKQTLSNATALQTLKGYAKTCGVSKFTIQWYTKDALHSIYEITISTK